MNNIDTQAITIWMTGLSGAGKTTVSNTLIRHLKNAGKNCVLLDGDLLREGLCRDLGFGEVDRTENIRRVAEVAHLFNQHGIDSICALISPLKVHRDLARSIIGEAAFKEVYIATPMAACEARDAKGLYKRARAGTLPQFTGVSAPYEIPEDPVFRIDTSVLDQEKAAQVLMPLFAIK